MGGSSLLTFDCGRLPADAAVFAAGHTPNGYFWTGVAQYVAGPVLSVVELDPDANMFCAIGDRAVLERLGDELAAYLDDPEEIARLIREAEAAGFELDD